MYFVCVCVVVVVVTETAGEERVGLAHFEASEDHQVSYLERTWGEGRL